VLRNASEGISTGLPVTITYGSTVLMKWELCCVLPFLLATASLALPSNAPYYDSSEPHQAAFRVDGVSEQSSLEWQQPPNPNSTHHLIFSSVSGLLQRWPNAYRINGASDPFWLPQNLTG
jgi:hypothetical protein